MPIANEGISDAVKKEICEADYLLVEYEDIFLKLARAIEERHGIK